MKKINKWQFQIQHCKGGETMQCEQCGLDGYIRNREILFSGDDSPNTKTQAFYRLHFHCENPNCERYGSEIGTTEIEIS